MLEQYIYYQSYSIFSEERNTHIHQHKDIAIGMFPASLVANLFVAIYKETHITTFPAIILHFFKRFIDDGFGIWLRNSDQQINLQNWEQFQNLINSMGLMWELSQRSNEVVFMDLTITITNGKISTKLYAKPMALHLYIPPFSCHTPGISMGQINGHFFRVMMLCTHQHEIDHELSNFLHRLLDRRYTLPYLLPIFLSTEQKAPAHQSNYLHQHINPPTHHQKQNPQNDATFLHLPFHPTNPPSTNIQQIWRSTVLTPPMKPPLYCLRNREGHPIDIQQLTITYSHAPNLGNILSCRVLQAQIRDYTDKDTHPMLFGDEAEAKDPLPTSTTIEDTCMVTKVKHLSPNFTVTPS